MNYLPLFLNVKDKPCVVVGGGFVGHRKATALVEAGARVTVISPKIDEAFTNDVLGGRVQHIRRVYRKGDLKGCLIAYAATGRPDVDEAMMAEAQAERVLLNVVDRTSMCDFIAPAVFCRGDITVAVSTNGKGPGFAKLIRQKLEKVVTPEYATVLSIVEAKRNELQRSVTSFNDRKRCLNEFTESILELYSLKYAEEGDG